MSNFLETIFHLDASENIPGLVEFIQDKAHDPNELLSATLQLLSKVRLRSASTLAMTLANSGYGHPIISIARSIGGIIHNTPEEVTQGLANLPTQMHLLSVEQQATLYNQVMTPVLSQLLTTAVRNADNPQILQVLEVLKASIPQMQTIFNENSIVPPLSAEGMRHQGQVQSQLITYLSPPPNAPRARRRVVIAMRASTAIDQAWARPSMVGIRLKTAMDTYGWQAKLYSMTCLDMADEYQVIAETCRRHDAELLILDDDKMIGPGKVLRAKMLSQLRQEMPSLKVAGLLHDTWSIDPAILTETTPFLDLLLNTTSPSFPLWKDPLFSHKVLNIPMPHAGYSATPDQPLLPKLLFAGSITPLNWHRAFWLSAAERLGLPIEKSLSTPHPGNLSALESYALYMQKLTNATCCLNLTMRPNQTCVVLDRSFEVILSGALLVQETTPDMHHYFVAGEHYLEFSTLAELAAVTQFIVENREEAEEIRRRGHAFAREQYNDEKLIRYIDKHLYFPDQPAKLSSFQELTKVPVAVKVVDVGANPIDAKPPYMPLLQSGAQIVGFEPNPKGLAKLNEQKGPNETYLPHAVGDGERHTLHFCHAQGMTSLLKPNPEVISLFLGFPAWSHVVSTEEIDTIRLDDVPETAGLDLLKIDIQGAELMVLRHAQARLRDALVIQAEVEFMKLYVDQPLFSDVEQFLREHGFQFHRFFPTVSRVIHPLVEDVSDKGHTGMNQLLQAVLQGRDDLYTGMSQLVWADAIFVRDFTQLQQLSDRDLLSMAAILHDCYQSFDLVLYLLAEYDRRTGNRIRPAYLSGIANHWPYNKSFLT